ncbi:MAG TPA: hypothetical protein DCL29_00290 [Eubacterium sp.]|nr:hypothetical protein [Eubacterium sp.]
MSRSYKKFPISRMVLWGRSMKKGKQVSNRKIRRKLKNPNLEISNGSHYKSLGLDSWELWEFKFLETKQDAIDQWETDQKLIANDIQSWRTMRDWSLSDQLNDWAKFHQRK